MASWGRVAAVVRNVLRSPRSLNSVALRRAVGSGILGSVVGTGVICYYQYHANNRSLPFAVHAEEQKVSTLPIKVSVVDSDRRHTDRCDPGTFHTSVCFTIKKHVAKYK